MSDESFPDNVDKSRQESAIVQRLFALAAQRLGGGSALVQHLGVTYSELRTYLSGEAMPPQEVFLRTVELVGEDLKMVKSEFSEQALRLLLGGSRLS